MPTMKTLTIGGTTYDLEGGVTSVNGQTGAVVLGAADVGAATEQDIADAIIQVLPVDSASGAVASFPDGYPAPVEALSCAITPVQDLHGQSSPYPAGGGKQLVNPDTVSNGYISDSTGNFNANNNARATDYIPVLPSTDYYILSSKTGGNRGAWYDENKTFVSGFSLSSSTSGVRQSPATAKYMRFTLSYENNNPDYATNVMIAKSSVAVPYAPYSNICPITGWSEAVVTRTGANLYDYTSATLYKGLLQTSDSVSTWRSSSDSRSFVVKCLPNTAYRIEVAAAESTIFRVGDVDTLPVGTTDWGDITLGKVYSQSTTGVIDYTTSATANYLVIQGGRTAVDSGTFKQTLSVNYPATVTGYHAYSGQTVTIDLSGTRYGGTLDVKTGVLTVTHGFDQFTWGDRLATYEPSGNSFKRGTFALSSGAVAGAGHSIMNCIGTYNAGMPSTTAYWYIDTYLYAWVPVATTDDFVLQCCYELTTPLSVQLTANELETILGQNNVWANCGDVAVSYRADIQRYIEKKLS